MKLSDLFRNTAQQAGGRLASLADRQEGLLAQRKKLRNVRERFERMTKDGDVSDRELDELMALLRDSGVDASRLLQWLDESEGAPDSAALADIVGDMLSDADDDASDSEANVNFQIQLELSEYGHAIEAASTIDKSGHDADMAVIRNMLS